VRIFKVEPEFNRGDPMTSRFEEEERGGLSGRVVVERPLI